MKNINDLYNISITDNNIIYSVDMLRLKAYIDYNTYNNLDYYIRTYHNNKIKKYWITDRIMLFKYNYVIEIEEGISFYIGFHHNNEKKDEFHGLFNFTIEFNPNKLKNNSILLHILSLTDNWFIKSYDIAFDLKIGINDIIYDMSNKRLCKIDNRGFDDKTIMLGKGDGRIKIYNKKRESDLQIIGEFTRIEISREVEDFPILDIDKFSYDNNFPVIYTSQYMYTLSDYKDKTLLALLYAVQAGFPLRDLTKTYRNKVKSLFEGGYKIEFNNKIVTELIKNVIFFYFKNTRK